MNKIWNNEPIIVITLDTDWASEYTLNYAYNILEKYSIKSTFFLTNYSVYLIDLINKGFIDGGIHPNFLPNSSQGSTYNEVIEYCMKILPDGISYRCHRYFDVNDIAELFVEKGFKYDSNLCTYLERIEPFRHRSGLIRFPVYLEDGAYLLHKGDLNFSNIKEDMFYKPGLMIINIHPMHLILNTPSFDFMKKIKGKLTRTEWASLSKKELIDLSYKGQGIRHFFIELFKFINQENIRIYTLYELYNYLIKL